MRDVPMVIRNAWRSNRESAPLGRGHLCALKTANGRSPLWHTLRRTRAEARALRDAMNRANLFRVHVVRVEIEAVRCAADGSAPDA